LRKLLYQVWKYIGDLFSFGGMYSKEINESIERSRQILEESFTPKLKRILEENKNG